MTRLAWRPKALEDRGHIFDYIAADDAGAALALDDAFEDFAETARKNPLAFKKGRVRGTREIVVRPNYVMVYQIEDEGKTVAILRLLHARQMWP